MPVTPTQFMRERPEFAPAGAALVATALAEATAELSADAWGANYDTAVSLRAAHKLWSSPWGAALRLDGGGDQETSRFSEQLAALRVARVPRMIVLR